MRGSPATNLGGEAERDTVLRAPSVWATFVENYGPTKMLAASLDVGRRRRLHRDWIELFEASRDGDEVVQSRTYLLINGTRR